MTTSWPTSVDRTIQRGAVQRTGPAQSYHVLTDAPGEAHVAREDLAVRRSGTPGRSLAYIAHLTDIQLLDVQSPARLEVLHGFGDSADTRRLLPMQRPQELLAPHATDALIRTLNRIRISPLTGAALDLAMTTGDNVDNMQWNEMQAYVRLLSGGPVQLDSGGPVYEGTQDGSVDWAWNPERADVGWAHAHGFPAVPGLVEAGLRPFHATGLDVPWVTCHGNHDGLVQGRTAATPELEKVMTGDRKVYGIPPGPLGDFVTNPMHLFSGPCRQVHASAERRPAKRGEFVRAHFDDGGQPHGHGFTAENVDAGTAYYAHDAIPGVRIIMLDTTNPAGHFEGSIDERQLAWLEARLAEVHVRHHDAGGRVVSGGGDERLVLIASHHPRASMTNDIAPAADHPDAGRRILGDELAGVLDRYPNVLAWISGHTHRHHVRLHQGQRHPFWEITTGSIMEWPSQARLLEIVENDDGTVSLVSTIVDHDTALVPGGTDTVDELASWHRELAANSPYSVGGRDASGTAGDRNVELVIPDPRIAAR
ncbi:TIGR03767 family metallophosphoesterase [Phytoactinopolyspora halophila]|uniref:TIGR03767 family metallophosphoesterase n=1 Tax=Phytoactinopolyspora halophila TaxID=1981511 RepID=A0A329QQV9_9ACTN|nr:TIGR03767 family metallophosphoesterase [Phytoactinopolyspora halophila]RAW13732.1 TIGR03767 family metallophosphoesterase [Phytoactinopolyspora halophila]